ncbi:ATP-binding protein [Nocardioides zeae]|uniref:ATP-binding protein n=1 Tax=Nocardioides imazamoxiresistens TaxID=3231893 RepID=A0ABU3PRF3_9ACTN|nr:ATP-binding protein [Nocardioides zeae]MDT9591799.1 ATP-binding protein [Nocardioides zeae]
MDERTDDAISFSTELPFAERSTTLARSLLRHHLHQGGAGRVLAENAMLVLHELVSNCIDHAYPCPNETLQLSWDVRPDRVDLRVTDHGPHPRCSRCHPARFGEVDPLEPPAGAPAGRTGVTIEAREPDLAAPRGRGLLIVQGLSHRWDVTTTEAATTVTATILASGRAAGSPDATGEPAASGQSG